MTVAEVLFGRATKHGAISEHDWNSFLAREVTPRFPAGLTVIDARGQWRDRESSKIVREPSKLVIVAFRDDPAERTKLDAIADSYKKQFKQQSVAILTRSVCASF